MAYKPLAAAEERWRTHLTLCPNAACQDDECLPSCRYRRMA